MIRFSSIGDLVLTSPVIRCLHEQTGAEIHVVTKSRFQDVLVHNPHVHKIWTLEQGWEVLLPALRKEGFGRVVDLHKNWRSYWLCLNLGRPVIRFDKLNWQKALMVGFKIHQLPHKHLVDRYFDALGAIGIVNDGNGLDYYIGPEDLKSVAAMELPSAYWVGVLGATYFTKQIPLVKWKELLASTDRQLVLLGGPGEKELGAELNDYAGDKVINLSGQLSLGQSAAVIRSSKVVITPDTGMMHIAAAFKKPMHVFWGNTIPDFGMYPYFGTQTVLFRNHEVEGLSCRPCSKLGYPSCPKGHFKCMLEQNITGQHLDF